MLDSLIHIEKFANQIPLELFVTIGSLLEELIAPIPSPAVMTTSGSLLHSQGYHISYILILALLSSLGKTLGSIIFYKVSDKAEDILLGKFGKFIGISHKSVEHIGKHFNGTHKDFFVLLLLRALPVVPSTPTSVLCGIIKLNLKTFTLATFVGNIIRGLFFLYIGYTGISTLNNGIEGIESLVTLAIAGIIGIVIIYSYIHRSKLKN